MDTSSNPINRNVISSSVKGLTIRRNSYHLAKMVRGVRINHVMGRLENISLQEAERKAQDLIKEVQQYGKLALEQFVDASNNKRFDNIIISVAQVANELVESASEFGTRKTGNRPWRPHTVQNFRSQINQPRLKNIMATDVREVSQTDILLWYRENLNAGYPAATHNAYRLLSRIFKWAISKSYIQNNPCKLVPSEESRHFLMRTNNNIEINTTDLGNYVAALATHQPKISRVNDQTTTDLLVAMLITGLGIGLIKSLEWEWVNFIDRSIIIPGEWKNQYSNFYGTKNRRDFWLPLPKILMTMLKSRFKNRENLASQQNGNAAMHFVFPNRDGNGPVADVRKRQFNILQAIGLDAYSFRNLKLMFSNLTKQVNENYIYQSQLSNRGVSIVTGYYMNSDDRAQRRKHFQYISDFLSQCMPVTIEGRLYSGLKEYNSSSNKLVDPKPISPDAFEKLLYNPIWRGREWVSHEAVERSIVGWHPQRPRN